MFLSIPKSNFYLIVLFWLLRFLPLSGPLQGLLFCFLIILINGKIAWSFPLGIPTARAFGFLLLIPVVPAIIRSDWVVVREVIGNLSLLYVLISAFVTSPIRPDLCKHTILLYVLPLCLIGFVFGSGFNVNLLLEGFSPFVRSVFKPLGGTHHFLGIFSCFYFIESLIASSRKDMLLAAMLLTLSGAVSYILSLTISLILYFILNKNVLSRLTGIVSRLLLVLFFALFVVFASSYDVDGFSSINSASISRNSSAKQRYTAVSGRDTLWLYNLELFRNNIFVGGGASSVRLDKTTALASGIYTESNIRLQAFSESYFDYYLARDGLVGFVYIVVWLFLLFKSSSSANRGVFLLVLFGFFSAAFSGFTKNAYSFSVILYIALVCRQLVIGSPRITSFNKLNSA